MRRRSEFLRVRKHGRSFGGRYLVLAVLPAAEIDAFKVGFIVPKRVGNAVARNRVKRRLRMIVAETASALQPKHFLTTIARKGAAEQPFAVLRKEWRRLAKRANLYHNGPVSDPASSPSTAAIAPATAATRHQHG